MRMKRLMSLLLAAVVLLQGATTVYAGNTDPDSPALIQPEDSDLCAPMVDISADSDAGVGDLDAAGEDTGSAADVAIDGMDADGSGDVVIGLPEEEGTEADIEWVDIMQETDEQSGDITQDEEAPALTLTEAQRADKALLAEHLSEIEGAVESVDFLADEIMVEAEDEAQAQLFAEAFEGELLSYDPDCGVAFIHVEDVKAAVIASAGPDTDLPAAWPIYIQIPAGEASDNGIEPAAANATADAEEGAEAGADEPELLNYTPLYSDPYLKKSNANYQWHHEMLDSNAAWKAGYTGKGIRVAILDTGVMPGHTEFKNSANNKIIGKAYYQVTGQNKGMVKADTLNDKNGNGTHLAGLVAAVAGNGALGCGVAPDAQLLVANIHDPNLEYATTESLYYALQFVRKDWKPDIVVIGTNFYGYSKLVEEQMTLLYEDGIAVFCAAGDDGSNQTVYPAGCKRAISVGAVGMNNKPTETSNNNTQIRYSGPGYEVVSSFKTSSTASEKITGTAQACGCVAGAAAVLLGSGKVSGNGAQRVENLLKLLDKGCKASGLGRGTPDLAVSLGVRKSSAPPSVPVSSVPSCTIVDESLRVRLSTDDGTMIYYTLDGTNPVYAKDGTINGQLWQNLSSDLVIPGDKKVLLKMIAVAQDTHQSSAIATYTYEFKPLVTKVTVTAENNMIRVAKGNSLQLYAEVTPSYAGNPKLRWDVVATPPGIVVNKNGKVTVLKNFDCTGGEKSVTIRASATDHGDVNPYGDIVLKITDPTAEPPVKTIKPATNKVIVIAGDTATASKTVNVTVTRTDGSTADAAAKTTWYAKDPAVAGVTIKNNTLTITGKSLGKTAVIGLANDGSGKRTQITVIVQQYVTKVSIEGPKGKTLQIGKQALLTAVTTPAKVTNKNMLWSMTGTPKTTTISGCGVTINKSNGRVSAGKKAVPGTYRFKATAVDRGKISSAEYELTVTDNTIKKIVLKQNNEPSYRDRIFRVTNGTGAKVKTSFTIELTGGTATASAPLSCVSVTNSNPKIVKMTTSDQKKEVTLESAGTGTGVANITVRSTDGSNLTKVFTVYVCNPAMGLNLTLPAGRSKFLAYGCTMRLIPNISAENGDLDASATKYHWESTNPELISVHPSNGTVMGRSEMGIKYEGREAVTITCTTTDGSNLSASIRLHPTGRTARFTAEKMTEADGYDIRTVCVEAGSFVGTDYKAKVNKAGLGAVIKADSSDCAIAHLYLYGQKQGTYTVTVSKMDGSAAVINRKVVVEEYTTPSGDTAFTLILK